MRSCHLALPAGPWPGCNGVAAGMRVGAGLDLPVGSRLGPFCGWIERFSAVAVEAAQC